MHYKYFHAFVKVGLPDTTLLALMP